MRSETPSYTATFVLFFGFALLVLVVAALIKGHFKLTRNKSIVRDEAPEAFWSWVIGMIVIGIPAFVYGILHMHPGG